MKLKAILTLAALASTATALTGCGSKEALETALNTLPPPGERKSREKIVAQGKNNGKEFAAMSAGLSRDPYISDKYQLVVYNEKNGSACYGLGNVFVKIPVSETGTIGKHELRAGDRTRSAVFTDGSTEYREGQGYVEIEELGTKQGNAKILIGQADSENFLVGELEFENCVK
jgi:hypothetical protein